MRALAAVLTVLLGCGLLAGCQEEPEPTPAKESPKLSQERFLERGNEICVKGNKALDRRGADVDTSTPAKAQQAVRSIIVPGIREQVADLRALRGPGKLERRLDPVLDETDRILDFLSEDPERYADADLLFAGVNKDLTNLGLDACGASS